MLIKLTTKCSMGCKHCINDAKPNGEHMTMDVLKDVLNFIKNVNIKGTIVLSGGEPTENPLFCDMCKYIMEFTMENDLDLNYIVATNGFWVLEHPEETKEILSYGNKTRNITFQVSADVRYYPERLPVHKRIFREPGIRIVDDCVQAIYPQGRAVTNGLEPSKLLTVPKCTNCKLIAAQELIKNRPPKLSTIVNHLAKAKKMCTPHIRPNGDIALGESDLCPVCSTIYKSDMDIAQDILNMNCSACEQYLYKPKDNEQPAFRLVTNEERMQKIYANKRV